METKHARNVIWTSVAAGSLLLVIVSVLVYNFEFSDTEQYGDSQISLPVQIETAMNDYESRVKGPGISDTALGLPAGASASDALSAYLNASNNTPNEADFSDSYVDLSE